MSWPVGSVKRTRSPVSSISPAGMRSGGHTVGIQVFLELGQRCIAIDLEGEEVDAGLVGFAQHQAVVVPLVPGLEVDAALLVAAGFPETQNIAVKVDAFLEIEHAQSGVAGTQYTIHCHDYDSSCVDFRLLD